MQKYTGILMLSCILFQAGCTANHAPDNKDHAVDIFSAINQKIRDDRVSLKRQRGDLDKAYEKIASQFEKNGFSEDDARKAIHDSRRLYSDEIRTSDTLLLRYAERSSGEINRKYNSERRDTKSLVPEIAIAADKLLSFVVDLGKLTIVTNPTGATLSLAGVSHNFDPTNTNVWVKPAVYEIALTLPGYCPLKIVDEVRSEKTTTLDVELLKISDDGCR